MAYIYGIIMCIISLINRHNGNVFSADMEEAACAICFAIASIKQERTQ